MPGRRVFAKPKVKRNRRYKKSSLSKNTTRAIQSIVNKQINRVVETKETTIPSAVNVGLPHNNIYIVNNSGGSVLNPFHTIQGVQDQMSGLGNRIGDQISVRGLLIKGMLEGALQRSKVHFKIMLIRGSKGDSFARADIFKNNTNNKLLDQLNVERYKIIASTTFNVSAPNSVGSAVGATGVPTAGVFGRTGNRLFKMWIPGKMFGSRGVVKYENSSTTQVRTYDYRLVILAYDWYGTPQDVNNVGILNELYTKLYFKDA